MGFVLEANLISVDNAIVLMASVTDQRNTCIMDISRDCFSACKVPARPRVWQRRGWQDRSFRRDRWHGRK